MDEILEIITSQLESTYVVFQLSKRMLKNSEFNATEQIREFLVAEGIFDFDELKDASKEYVEGMILGMDESRKTRIRLGFPPVKREARIWIYGLNDFVVADDKVLMGLIENNLVIIPLNQSKNSYQNLIPLVRTSKLDKKSKKRLKNKKREKKFKAFKKDYVKQAMENTKLGLEGELFVVFSEKQRLISAERKDLAEKVEHTSAEKGDGLGYDILSYDINGVEKFIEVKTTTGSCNSRLFLSMNEIDFSCKNSENFFLFRVYEFNNSQKLGKIKVIKGCLSDNIEIEPTSFSAVVEE